MALWRTFLRPTSLADALALVAEHAGRARIVAGGTDLLVELSRGQNPTETVIDLSGVRELKYVREDGGVIRLGALATHNDVVSSPACVARALPLAQACWEVGAPQLRTRGTVAGNVVTASPANDTITPLVALDAEAVLASVGGERVVPLSEFYPGFRRTALRPDELVREIRIPALAANQRGLFLKLGLRRAQAISVVDAALVVALDGERVTEARIALGAVAPTIVRAPTAEAYVVGKNLDSAVCETAGRLVVEDVAPIDDLRGSASYRRAALANLIAHGLERIAAGPISDDRLTAPVLLDTGGNGYAPRPFDGTIRAVVNDRPVAMPGAAGKTLLDALREDAGLTGTKEGCAEGECGACTVWLDGQAVMACLVPAPQADGAVVTTIEGLATGDGLHPLQQSFIDRGAVQCGYCIPGMLMAGAMLLAERPTPSEEDVQVALSGNLCRCTGYRKILDAVLDAGETR